MKIDKSNQISFNKDGKRHLHLKGDILQIDFFAFAWRFAIVADVLSCGVNKLFFRLKNIIFILYFR